MIKAADEIGFEPARYPKPDREKGVVTLMAKAGMGERIAKALFFTTLWKHYILEVHIKREGAIATGVEIKVTQGSGVKADKEEMGQLNDAYIKALKKFWK